ncbi:MAG: hypothetical protein AB2L20_14995 [Mangrovibacterium sp.]
MKNIEKVLELQASYDDLKHAIDGIFLKLTNPGNVSRRSDNSTIQFIHKKIESLQKAEAAYSDLLSAAEEIARLHACEQEGIASGQPTPEQWYQAVNNLNDAIQKIKNN